MPRHYTDEEKRLVLDRLIANYGDVDLTVSQTAIPERTVARWKKDAQRNGTLLPPPPPMPPSASDSLPSPVTTGEGLGLGVSSLPEEITDRLTALRQEMLDAADTLSRSIVSAIEDAPLNQRVAALAQLIDRIIKLATQLPQTEEEIEYVYKYKVAHHVEKEDENEDENSEASGDRAGDQPTETTPQSEESFAE